MEVGSYRRGSDATSELFDDFAALPEQFRPKKTFIRTEPKNPTVIPKPSIRKENRSDSKNATCDEGSLGKPSDSSPVSVSKSVMEEKNGKSTLSSSSNTLPRNGVKTHLQDHGTQSKRCVLKKDVDKNPARKGPSLSKKFSEISVETAHTEPQDTTTKVKKRTVWNNDLVIQTEPQVWKFNGSTLEPEKTDYRRVTKKRTMVAKNTNERNASSKNRSAWNDNMDLVVEKKVNFGYISQETRNGGSTITACWGDVRQTRPLGPTSKQKQHVVDKPPRKTLHDAKHGETEHRPIADDKPVGRRRRSNKNVKTTVVRHEIKVIHVNEKGEPLSQKEAASRGPLPLEDLFPRSCKDRLFAFGTKAGLEDSHQLFHCAVPSKSKEHSTSDDTPSKRPGKYFDRETPEALVDHSSKDQMRSSFLRYGREISDVVAESHVARSTLVALFDKWIPVRNRTIELMEKLAESVSSSRRRNSRIQKAVDLIQSGSHMATAVPNIKVTIVARIIAAIAPFVAMLFKSSPQQTAGGTTETDMMNQIQDDVEATLEVYMFGTQCDHQFREARELLEEFRAFVDADADSIGEFTGAAEFVSDVSFCSPTNLGVYYRRLHGAFLGLRDSPTVGRTFRFEDGAIETVRLLHWRFPAQIEDSEAFQRAWKEVSRVLDGASDTEVLENVRDCVNILRKERRTIENNMAELRENIE